MDKSFVVSVDRAGSALSTEYADFEAAENAWQQASLRMREGEILGVALYRLDPDGSVRPIQFGCSALQEEEDLFDEICSEVRESLH